MTTYAIKEIFQTLQGEGFHAGRKAVFIRFAGCNLWSGREEDREKGKGACARWCDTDFVGGEKITASEIAAIAVQVYGASDLSHQRLAVVTGGEPALQFDGELRNALRQEQFMVAMETNGTVAVEFKDRPDWITLSPKLGGEVLLSGQIEELKVVLPGHVNPMLGWTQAQLLEMVSAGAAGKYPRAAYYYVQPQDGPNQVTAVRQCIDFVLAHPAWKFSTQTHKVLGLR